MPEIATLAKLSELVDQDKNFWDKGTTTVIYRGHGAKSFRLRPKVGRLTAPPDSATPGKVNEDLILESLTARPTLSSATSTSSGSTTSTPNSSNHGSNLIAALTRLCGRNTTSGDLYKAEAIGLVVWHPEMDPKIRTSS